MEFLPTNISESDNDSEVDLLLQTFSARIKNSYNNFD